MVEGVQDVEFDGFGDGGKGEAAGEEQAALFDCGGGAGVDFERFACGVYGEGVEGDLLDGGGGDFAGLVVEFLHLLLCLADDRGEDHLRRGGLAEDAVLLVVWQAELFECLGELFCGRAATDACDGELV